MSEQVRISFSQAAQTSQMLLQETEQLYEMWQRLAQTTHLLMGMECEAAFRLEIEARWEEIREQIRHLIETCHEVGCDLQNAARCFQEFDADCTALFETERDETGLPYSAELWQPAIPNPGGFEIRPWHPGIDQPGRTDFRTHIARHQNGGTPVTSDQVFGANTAASALALYASART